VVTLSGRPAQIQAVDLHTVAAGINPAALVQPGTPPGTNAVPFLTSAVPVGPVLDVVPVVAADGRGVALTVISTVTEFLGYDAPPADGTVRVWENGKDKAVVLPLPRFRVRQMQTQASVVSGGTLVLAGFPVESERLAKDKVPVLGDLPLAGRLFRSESKGTVTKHLLVFVTATIVDPAGNAVAAPARASASAGTALRKE
jgi:general secretion pathway protein D